MILRQSIKYKKASKCFKEAIGDRFGERKDSVSVVLVSWDLSVGGERLQDPVSENCIRCTQS